MQKVRDTGLWEKTAILFTSDHGWNHGEHGLMGKHTVIDRKKGWPFYEEVAHTPLLLRVPGLSPGARSDLLVQPVDMMPTLLEIASAGGGSALGGGLRPPDAIHGRSFLNALKGQAAHTRRIAVTSATLTPDPTSTIYSNITDGEWSLNYGGEGGEALLHHLPSDPRQERNVIQEQRSKAAALHAEYVRLLETIGTEEDRLKLRRRLE
jgi:arylsulfatase A-like enzyme